MATKEPSPELQSLGLDIFKTFKSLIERPGDSDQAIEIPSRRRLVTEEERFRLWAHNLGLHQKGHASLDYRVRDASIIKSYLANLLVELKDHLENREYSHASAMSIGSFEKLRPSIVVIDRLWNLTTRSIVKMVPTTKKSLFPGQVARAPFTKSISE